jgi:hypothetical protein
MQLSVLSFMLLVVSHSDDGAARTAQTVRNPAQAKNNILILRFTQSHSHYKHLTPNSTHARSRSV